MTETTAARLRTTLLGLAGAALGFGFAVGALLGPPGWVVAVLLVVALCWLMVRVQKQGGRLWLAVGVGAAVGLLFYIGLALIQNLFDAPASGSGSSPFEGASLSPNTFN